jgi:putative membrane protein
VNRGNVVTIDLFRLLLENNVMELAGNVLVGFVAAIHAVILAVEIFLWRSPRVHGRLGFTQEQADKVAPIVANVGLYNGFLAIGLTWSLFAPSDFFSLRAFFLICVIVAGAFGAVTIKWTTLVLQSAPAAAALIGCWLSRS